MGCSSSTDPSNTPVVAAPPPHDPKEKLSVVDSSPHAVVSLSTVVQEQSATDRGVLLATSKESLQVSPSVEKVCVIDNAKDVSKTSETDFDAVTASTLAVALPKKDELEVHVENASLVSSDMMAEQQQWGEQNQQNQVAGTVSSEAIDFTNDYIQVVGTSNKPMDFLVLMKLDWLNLLIAESIMAHSMLQEMFSIYDEDEDGYLNVDQFNDLMNMIHLSYGKQCEERFPEKSIFQPQQQQQETLATAVSPPDPHPSPSAIGTSGKLTLALGSIDSSVGGGSTGSLTPLSVSSAPAAIDSGSKADIRRSIETNFKMRSAASSGRADGRSRAAASAAAAAAAAMAADERPKSADADMAKPKRNLRADRPAPGAKSGFLIKHDSHDSLPATVASPKSHRRFVTLDQGELTYLDSTSREKQVSLENRRLSLRGAKITVVSDSQIEISTPTKKNSRSINFEIEDMEKILLEIPNKNDKDGWVDAISKHIDFQKPEKIRHKMMQPPSASKSFTSPIAEGTSEETDYEDGNEEADDVEDRLEEMVM